MHSFFGSVTNGFMDGFTLGGCVSCIDMSLKNVALAFRRVQILRISAVASAVVGGGLVGGVFLGTMHGASYSTQVHAVDDIVKAMIAGGFVGATSETPVYLRDKVGATLTRQGMRLMRRRPLFLTKSFVGAHIGGALYVLLREDDPQGSPHAPRAPAQGSQEGSELDMWNSSKSLETTGEWVTTNPSSGGLLEQELNLASLYFRGPS